MPENVNFPGTEVTFEDACKEFYEVYTKASKKWGMYMNCHRSMIDGCRMEIYRDMGDEREYVLRISTEDDTELYIRATRELKYYVREREEKILRIARGA